MSRGWRRKEHLYIKLDCRVKPDNDEGSLRAQRSNPDINEGVFEMDFVEVDTYVKVVAVFRSGGNIGTSVMPIKLLYGGREVVFSELGLYHPTTVGRRMIHVFDMSDGGSDYRLEFDAERLVWKLRSISTVD
jgi:hypothetical protein